MNTEETKMVETEETTEAEEVEVSVADMKAELLKRVRTDDNEGADKEEIEAMDEDEIKDAYTEMTDLDEASKKPKPLTPPKKDEKPKTPAKVESQTKLKFKGKIDTKVFKRVTTAIGEMIDEGTLFISADGLRARCMDTSQIAMIDLNLSPKDFTEFVLDGLRDDLKPEQKILNVGIDFNDLKNCLKGMDESHINLQMSDVMIHLDTIGEGMEQHGNMRAIDTNTTMPKEPVIDYQSEFEVSKGVLGAILKVADNYGINNLEIVAKADGVYFNLSDENKGTNFHLKNSGEKMKVKTKRAIPKNMEAEGVRARYSVEYLQKTIAGADALHPITMKLATERPLYIGYTLSGDNSKVSCYLAPRIDHPSN